MGNITSDHMDLKHFTAPHKWLPAHEWPNDRKESPYDPMYGFPNGRKPREMIATEAEMDSAKLLPEQRDYCAHLYMELKGCLKSNCPLGYRCLHELHAYHDCEWEDQVLRMKDWEREKRLRQRDLRRQKQELRESQEKLG
ncbi:NADH dehydrogenase [ubiquinone] 1 beta subcomplex subunit 7-like [Oppia nitens]|uniref:NADH dehydrogenase [ubiquinone] 1 beta subcomplex subunit 7-like n=1 Tax=Oppia nitens TaxID=1686743 RepID=UPI0023DAC028|nr:NADH dehydrogenase [ubiquinone] 1 beta subcomplex subunit 7-like [Oppia nitens]